MNALQKWSLCCYPGKNPKIRIHVHRADITYERAKREQSPPLHGENPEGGLEIKFEQSVPPSKPVDIPPNQAELSVSESRDSEATSIQTDDILITGDEEDGYLEANDGYLPVILPDALPANRTRWLANEADIAFIKGLFENPMTAEEYMNGITDLEQRGVSFEMEEEGLAMKRRDSTSHVK